MAIKDTKPNQTILNGLKAVLSAFISQTYKGYDKKTYLQQSIKKSPDIRQLRQNSFFRGRNNPNSR